MPVRSRWWAPSALARRASLDLTPRSSSALRLPRRDRSGGACSRDGAGGSRAVSSVEKLGWSGPLLADLSRPLSEHLRERGGVHQLWSLLTDNEEEHS